MKWLYYSPIPQTVVSTLPRGLIISDFWEYIGCFLLASSILLLSTDDSFAEHRRFFCRAPTTLLLSTINTWTIQLTSFPQGVIFYFNRLFLFINWNIAECLVKVVLNQQTHATRPSWFCWQNGHVGPECFVELRKDMDLLSRMKWHQWDGASPLLLAPWRKRNDNRINPTCHLQPL